MKILEEEKIEVIVVMDEDKTVYKGNDVSLSEFQLLYKLMIFVIIIKNNFESLGGILWTGR